MGRWLEVDSSAQPPAPVFLIMTIRGFTRWTMFLLCGWMWMGCGRDREEKVDPHSMDGVLNHLTQHVGLLDEAAKRDDFKHVHDFAYYVKNLAQALYSSLDDTQKASVDPQLKEVLEVVDRLDSSSGRKQAEATQAGTRRLIELLGEIDSRLRPGKKTGKPAAAHRAPRHIQSVLRLTT
jgi:hypothetical protein